MAKEKAKTKKSNYKITKKQLYPAVLLVVFVGLFLFLGNTFKDSLFPNDMVAKGDNIKVEYEGRLEDGTVFDSTEKHGGEPLAFEVGAGQMIKGFDEGVLGMKLDEEKEIKLKPEEAYGEYNEDAVQKVPKRMMPAGIEVGMQIGVPLQNGQTIPATITEVKSDMVTIDMNHELAGKTLIFKIKVVAIN
jgi:peptidylprolyl isomerase